MILFIKKSPLWCKPGRRFFRSQCEDGFLTHLELPATPPPRAAWDTNSELLSPAPRRKLWKKFANLSVSLGEMPASVNQSDTGFSPASLHPVWKYCSSDSTPSTCHNRSITQSGTTLRTLQTKWVYYLSVFGQHFNIIQHNHQATFCSNWSEIFTCPTAHVPCLDHSCSHSELGTSRSWVCWINKTKNQE